MTALAVVWLSAATLAYQILLVRVFAIEQFHHFASMAIGVAMLGYGASGTLVALRRPGPEAARRWFPWSATLATLSLVAVPALVGRVAVDPTQLAWQAGQWARLGLVYLLLALPFGFGALAVLLGLTLAPTRTGAIYGASFLGSGLGALASVAVLALAVPSRALAAAALLAAPGALCAAAAHRTRGRVALAALVAAVAALAAAKPPWRLRVLPYKALPQAEAYPGARRVAEETSPVGWVVGVRAPALRFAPGLSLAYQGTFPPQVGLFADAQLAGAATTWDSATVPLLDWLPAAAPYELGRRHRVLVLGGAGSLDVAVALRHGALVTAVERHPDLARLAWPDVPPSLAAAGGRARWVPGDARAFVAHTRERYDLITLGPTGGIGGAAAGVHSLNEDFLATREAADRYLDRLTAEGVVAITTWVELPPKRAVREILTAAAALRQRDAAAHGLVVLRSWGTVTTLVKPSGFSTAEVAALERWADSRWFDVDWSPGLAAPQSRFNRLESPVLFEAARAATTSADAARRFADRYPLRVAPATDARPYPQHFLGLAALRTFAGRGAGEWLPFAELGYLALLATLAQSLVLAALLLLLPVVVRARGAMRRDLWRVLGYFAAIGLAYLLAELAAIQQLTLLLGHPVYAVAAVLAILLVCSGIGSWWSDRLPPARGVGASLVLTLLLAVCAVALLALVHRVESHALVARVAVAAAVLAPLGVLMGMPFPLGLRALAGTDVGRVAWAWAVNGFASVVAAPLGAIVGLELGSGALLGMGAVAYGMAGAVLLGTRGRPTLPAVQ